ncbi:MAG TPA: LuxR C-terminal-related transcriptional regulator [Longimicrobiales bacterium]
MEFRAPNHSPQNAEQTLLRYGNAAPDVITSLRRKYRLTPTQARVATLLADRLTNAEIALELHVRPSTARRHTEAVLLRLGVSSRFMVLTMIADHFAEARS